VTADPDAEVILSAFDDVAPPPVYMERSQSARARPGASHRQTPQTTETQRRRDIA